MSGLSVENAATSYSASSLGRIAHGAMVVITERLAELPDLALPSSLYKETARPPSTTDILAYLQALLQKDPAAFLARYGGVLQSQELNHFEALRSGDYEVHHWLNYFAAQRLDEAAQAANPRRLPAKVKNRRLAAMRRLAAQGEYFSDEAMRERAPLLYHQQIGRFVEQQQQQQQQQEEGLGPSEPDQVELQGHGDGSDRMQAQMHTEMEGAPLRQCRVHAAAPAGPGGGLGGSCLAGALRAAFEGRAGVLQQMDSSGGASTSGHATAAAAAAAPTAGVAAAAVLGASCRVGLSSKPSGPAPEPSGTGRGGAGGLHAPAPQQQNGDNSGAGTSLAGLGRMMGDGGGLSPGGCVGVKSAGAAMAADDCHPQSRAGGAPPAELLFSEFLMRQDDEAQLFMRRMQEQREEDAQMSEHESDDDEEEEQDSESEEAGEDGDCMAVEGRRVNDGASGRRRGRPSASDQALMRRDFVSEMQSRFLLGQDTQYVDYGTIDADASLDGDWLEEESRDAEEKYFDED